MTDKKSKGADWAWWPLSIGPSKSFRERAALVALHALVAKHPAILAKAGPGKEVKAADRADKQYWAVARGAWNYALALEALANASANAAVQNSLSLAVKTDAVRKKPQRRKPQRRKP